MELKVQHRTNVTLQPRQIRIVILAMFSGLLIYTTIAYVLSGNGVEPAAADQAVVFAGVLVALGVAFLIAAAVVGRVQTTVLDAMKANSSDVERGRVNAHLVAKLVKAALAEAFGLVGTTFMLVTGERYFLAASLIAVFCLIRLLPKRGARGPQNPQAGFGSEIGPGDSSHGRPIQP